MTKCISKKSESAVIQSHCNRVLLRCYLVLNHEFTNIPQGKYNRLYNQDGSLFGTAFVFALHLPSPNGQLSSTTI